MRPRNQSLDVLRALAVFLTMGIHFPVFATLHRAGWIGVDLFFVLSGYLISGLLFQEFHDTGGIRIGRFILRRGFKIWPPFYALILGTMADGRPSEVLDRGDRSKRFLSAKLFLFRSTLQESAALPHLVARGRRTFLPRAASSSGWDDPARKIYAQFSAVPVDSRNLRRRSGSMYDIAPL